MANESPVFSYFGGELPWQRQLREITERTSVWQGVQLGAVTRLQKNWAHQAGLGSVAMQVANIHRQWQEQWQLGNAASTVVAQYHEDLARHAGSGAIAAQALARQNDALRATMQATIPRDFMQAMTRSYTESIRDFLPAVSIQAELATSVAAKIAEALQKGWADLEVIEEAAEYVDEQFPEFSLAVQNSADGLVAWDEGDRAQMVLAGKAAFYIVVFVLLMHLFGGFKAESPDEALKIVLGGLAEAWASGKVIDLVTKPKKDDD